MASMEHLSPSDEEDEVLTFESNSNEGAQADPSLCLIGRFLTNKPIKNHVMKETIAIVWQPGRKIAIKEVNKGIYVFQFFHKIDLQRVTINQTLSLLVKLSANKVEEVRSVT
ncbi:hypothetical protein L195_g053297 [Trifolium pratense]|uniref:DUF4283 domain-containing protein n=1 Tax=Trifolium pratense TaxID=57577 RepID=A0A2K3K9Q4_TRIPR|nr:hypothetical protein L195_g053297 [Trifolium pratense]